MKILVLGGTRYMGYETACLLSQLGNQVTTLSRSEVPNIKWNHWVCDRKNLKDLASAFEQIKPQLVLDMVCFDKQDAIGITELGESGLLDSVSHYLMVSSFFLYNYFELREQPFVGDINLITDGYTRRKAEAETVLNSSDFFHKMSIARLPYVFSRNDYSGRFQKFVEISLSASETTHLDSFKTSMVSMTDASDSLAKIVLRSPLGYVDVSNDGYMTLGEIQNTIRNANGLIDSKPLSEIIRGPYPLTKNLCLNSTKWKIERKLKEALLLESAPLPTHQS